MSKWKHTPGPWHWNEQGWVYADVPDGITINGASDPYYGGHMVAESISLANGPLIAAAPDHALLLAAMSSGKATFERHGLELWVLVLRDFATFEKAWWERFKDVSLDAFGCPVMTTEMRAALNLAMAS